MPAMSKKNELVSLYFVRLDLCFHETGNNSVSFGHLQQVIYEIGTMVVYFLVAFSSPAVSSACNLPRRQVCTWKTSEFDTNLSL